MTIEDRHASDRRQTGVDASRVSPPANARDAAGAEDALPLAIPSTIPTAQILTVLDRMVEAFVALDREWRVTYQNAAAARLIGEPPAAGDAGTTCWEAWPAIAGTEIERQFRRAMTTQVPVHFEHLAVQPPDRDTWLDIRAYPSADGLAVFVRDISPQKRAEAELARADARFTLAAEAVNAIIYDWDIASNTVQRTRGVTEVMGYARTEEGPTVEWSMDLIHPDDRPSFDGCVQTALATGDSYAVEYRVRHRNGDYRHVLDQGRIIRDAGGQAVRVVGSAIDITTRKQAEAALRASEERLQVALRDSSVIVYQQDRDLRYTWVHNLDPRIWPDDIIGTTDADLLLPDEAARVIPLKIQVMETGQVIREEVRATAPTGPRVYDLTVEPLRDEHGAVIGVTGAAVDVTERKRAEDELRRRANLLDQADDAIFAWDWDGVITFWNRGAERLYGFTRQEAIGRSSHQLLRTHDAAASAGVLQALARDGSWEGELEHTRRDGGTVLVDTRHVLVEEDGNRYVLEVNRDVTERRALERSQQDFLAAASHDLKNPLGAIRGQAQLLRRRLERGGEPDIERLIAGLATIDATTGRMTALIEELLDVAKLRAGQSLDLQWQPVDLVALVRQCADEYQRTTERHAIRFETEIPHLSGVWDPRRLERVVANLLTNAIKYSPEGGEVAIRVGRDDGDGPPCAAIAVRDRGVGIPAADLPHIFEGYRRGANVGGIAGTGIGLAGAKRIVEQHGGTIAVTSGEGEGSTFTVRLPLSRVPTGSE